MSDLRTARKEHVDFTKKLVAKCWQKTGKAPVSVRWGDVNKGSVEVPEMRCRLVARDFKGKGDKDREDLFAATPPLEAKRALFSKAVTRRKKGRACRKLLFVDARKAHLNPECLEDVYIQLPDEVGSRPGFCGKLNFWLYGFRPAANAWEKHYAALLEGVGFQRGLASPVIFYHPLPDLSCVVHGDDFTVEGEGKELDWIQELMASWFEIKVRGRLGPEEGDDKEICILGRKVVWKSFGISCEADPKHRKMIMEFFGFDETSRKLTTNGAKEVEDAEVIEEKIALTAEEKTSFRAVAARLNYMSADCLDIQFPGKEVCRDMSNPTIDAFAKLKKTARYLVSRKAVRFKFVWQEEGARVSVFTDSDWGGCLRTRKSTSGGVVMLGAHCLKTWCLTQGAIALSSADRGIMAWWRELREA